MPRPSTSVAWGLCVLLLAVAAGAHDVPSSFGAADSAKLERALAETSISPKNVYHLSSALKIIGSGMLQSGQKILCGSVTAGFASGSAVAISQALRASVIAKCPVFKMPEMTAAMVQASKSENLEDVAAGVMGMQALVEGHSAKVPQDFDVTAISTKILSLHREDGTFAGTATDEDGTLMNAGLAAEALGALIALGGKKVDTSAITSSIGATYESLGEKIFDSVMEEASLGPASLALSSLVSLLKTVKTKYDLGIDCTSAVASLVMSLKTTASPYEAHNLLSAVAAIANGPSQQPIVVEAMSSRIASGKSKGAAFKVKLSDIQGKEVPKAKVGSAKLAASSDGSDIVVSEGLAIKSVGAGVWEVALPGDANLAAGRYSISVDVVSGDAKFGPGESTRPLLVSGSAALTMLSVATGKYKDILSDASAGDTQKSAAYPKGVSVPVSVKEGDGIRVSFTVSPFVPQQTSVRLSGPGGSATYRAYKAVGGKDGELTCVISVDSAGHELLASKSGRYAVDVLVGDAILDEALVWQAAAADITFKPAPDTVDGAGLLPELVHTPAAPPSRAPSIIALAFAGAVVACGGYLATSLSSMGVSLKVPSKAMPFLASLAASLLLVVVYWVGAGCAACAWGSLGAAALLHFTGGYALKGK